MEVMAVLANAGIPYVALGEAIFLQIGGLIGIIVIESLFINAWLHLVKRKSLSLSALVNSVSFLLGVLVVFSQPGQQVIRMVGSDALVLLVFFLITVLGETCLMCVLLKNVSRFKIFRVNCMTNVVTYVFLLFFVALPRTMSL